MEVRLSPDVWIKLDELVEYSGLPAEEVLEDAILSLYAASTNARANVNRRYDDLESGRIKAIDGRQVLARLRARRQAQL